MNAIRVSPRPSARCRPLRSAGALAALALLVTTSCAKSENTDSSPPPGTPATTAPDLNARLPEVRKFVADTMLENDHTKALAFVTGPATAVVRQSETLARIGGYISENGADPKTSKVDTDGLTELKKLDNGHIRAAGKVVTIDDQGEEKSFEEIELVEESGKLKLYDLRALDTGLKASVSVLEAGATAANDALDAKVITVACLPPGTYAKNDATLVLTFSYTAKGKVGAQLVNGSVKPAGGPAVKAAKGWSDVARATQTAYGVLLVPGAPFDKATVTLEFDDSNGQSLPTAELDTPAFPDPRLCRKAVTPPGSGSGTTGTTRGSAGTANRTTTTKASAGGPAQFDTLAARDKIITAVRNNGLDVSLDDWGLNQLIADQLGVGDDAIVAAASAAPAHGASVYAEVVYSKSLGKAITAFAINDGKTCGAAIIYGDDQPEQTKNVNDLTLERCSANQALSVGEG